MNFYPSPGNETKIRKLADASNMTNKNNQVTPIWERSTIDHDSNIKNVNNSEEVGLIAHDKPAKRSKLTLGSLQYAPTQTTAQATPQNIIGETP